MAAENKLILLMEYSTVPEISSELGVRNEKKKEKISHLWEEGKKNKMKNLQFQVARINVRT